jgi:hypothetical protein
VFEGGVAEDTAAEAEAVAHRAAVGDLVEAEVEVEEVEVEEVVDASEDVLEDVNKTLGGTWYNVAQIIYYFRSTYSSSSVKQNYYYFL